jgi:serine/threonine protein kinase
MRKTKRLIDSMKMKLKWWKLLKNLLVQKVNFHLFTIIIVSYIIYIAILFPKLLTNGYLEDKKLNFIVMNKYDIDLERLFVNYKRKFKLETIITIGLQVFERLEVMHNCGLIHNDLKP